MFYDLIGLPSQSLITVVGFSLHVTTYSICCECV